MMRSSETSLQILLQVFFSSLLPVCHRLAPCLISESDMRDFANFLIQFHRANFLGASQRPSHRREAPTSTPSQPLLLIFVRTPPPWPFLSAEEVLPQTISERVVQLSSLVCCHSPPTTDAEVFGFTKDFRRAISSHVSVCVCVCENVCHVCFVCFRIVFPKILVFVRSAHFSVEGFFVTSAPNRGNIETVSAYSPNRSKSVKQHTMLSKNVRFGAVHIRKMWKQHESGKKTAPD